jgi:hypothetical protein
MKNFRLASMLFGLGFGLGLAAAGGSAAAQGGNPCLREVMSGTVQWGGGTQWQPANAERLCARATDTEPVACFKAGLAAGLKWPQAIDACHVGSAHCVQQPGGGPKPGTAPLDWRDRFERCARGAAPPAGAPSPSTTPATLPTGTPRPPATTFTVPARDVAPDECQPGGICGDMSDPTQWRLMQPQGVIAAGAIPGDAHVIGSETAGGTRRNVYLCVIYLSNVRDLRRYIGRTGEGATGCIVTMNGAEHVVTRSFLVLVNPLPGPLNEMSAASWVRATDGAVIGRSIQTFGADLCRARQGSSLYPGRVVPGQGCAVGNGTGGEVIAKSYEVLVRPDRQKP